MRTPYNQLTEEQKERKRASVRAWQKRNREKVKATRDAYDKSPAGKESKKRCEARYKASGKRGDAEKRRSLVPLSKARKNARKKWAASDEGKAYRAAMTAYRRSIVRDLDEFNKFVLIEAYRLAKERSMIFGYQWEVDHIVPVSRGGLSVAGNLQVVPASWNRKKSNKHANKFFGA